MVNSSLCVVTAEVVVVILLGHIILSNFTEMHPDEMLASHHIQLLSILISIVVSERFVTNLKITTVIKCSCKLLILICHFVNMCHIIS